MIQPHSAAASRRDQSSATSGGSGTGSDLREGPGVISTGALVRAALLSLVGSIATDALLVHIGTGIFPSTKGYLHFRPLDYGALTTLGVLGACAAWFVVVRVSSQPRHLFFRLAIAVMLVLWLPDVWLLVSHQPARAVGVLMTMHLGVALVTYNALVRVAAPRKVAEEQPTETQPLSSNGAERSLRRLATALLVGVGLEFALGMAALFVLNLGRPSGWLPS
ncbi:MAG: hypothetical protein ACYDBS_05090, partial [Acidimicrobiales bacterium]